MWDFIINSLVFLMYIGAIIISSCFLIVLSKKPDCDNKAEEVVVNNDEEEVIFTKEKFDYAKVNEEIEAMKAKMTEQNKRFEEVIAEVQIAAMTAKIRDAKFEILGKCATINEKIVDAINS